MAATAAAISLAAALPSDSRADATLTAPGRHSLAEPHVAVDPAAPERVVVAAQSQDEGSEAHPMFSFASLDGGSTFTRTQLSAGTFRRPRECWFDPVVAFGTGGEAFLAHVQYPAVGGGRFTTSLKIERSRDGGRTFGETVTVARARHRGGRFPEPSCFFPDTPLPFDDKPWIAVDRSGGATHGRLYVVWARFREGRGRGERARILERHSDDDGETFSRRRRLDGRVSGDPQIAVRPGGRAVAVWVRRADALTARTELRAASGPAGRFGRPRTVTRFRNAGAVAGFDTIPTLAADAAGRLAACWAEQRGHGSRRPTVEVRCSRSRDARRWSGDVAVSRPARGVVQGLPALAAAPAGGFLLLVYETDGAGELRVRLLRSDDGARTFVEVAELERMELSLDAFTVGDYVGLDAAGRQPVAAYTAPSADPGVQAIRVKSLASLP